MKLRDIIFWIHLIAGVTLGVVIGFMAITGIILAFEPQIVDYAERKVRYVDRPMEAQKLSVAQILEKVAEQKPQFKPTSFIVRSNEKSSMVLSQGREGGAIYVDPYTGKVLGKGSIIHDWMHMVEDWHRWLGFKEIGKPITGAAIIVFFILLLLGIFIWFPATVLFFRKGLKGKARDWNWHNVIGIWSAPILFVTIVTGMIMSHQWANNFLYRVTGNQPPAQMRSPAEQGAEARGEKRELPVVDWDGALKIAQEKSPAWVSINIRAPHSQDKPINISIQEKFAGDVLGRSQLNLDVKILEVVKWEPWAQANLGMKARTWVKYLHTGQAFGSLHQLLMAIGALGAVFLVWTGFAMAWRRFFGNK